MQKSALAKALSNFRFLALDILGQNFGHNKRSVKEL